MECRSPVTGVGARGKGPKVSCPGTANLSSRSLHHPLCSAPQGVLLYAPKTSQSTHATTHSWRRPWKGEFSDTVGTSYLRPPGKVQQEELSEHSSSYKHPCAHFPLCCLHRTTSAVASSCDRNCTVSVHCYCSSNNVYLSLFCAHTATIRDASTPTGTMAHPRNDTESVDWNEWLEAEKLDEDLDQYGAWADE